MDILKAFTFFTEDERWIQKLGVGTAVVLISALLSPILIGFAGFFILAGYCVRLLQNVRDGHARPLPEWDRWGEDMVDGFKLTVVNFLYALPVFIFVIPMILGAVLMDSSQEAGFLGVPLLTCGICLVTLYALFLTVAQPAIMIVFAREKSIGSALRFRDVWEWTRRNIGPVIIVAFVYLAASAVIPFAAMVIGTILLVIGLIVTIPLSVLLLSLVQAHLYGQLAGADAMEGRAYTPAAPLAPVAPVAPARPAGPEAAFVIDPELGGRVELGTALGAELGTELGTVAVPPVSQLPPVAPPVDSFAGEVSEWTPAPLPPAEADVVDFAPAAPAPDAPVPDAPPADSPSGDAPRSDESGGWGI